MASGSGQIVVTEPGGGAGGSLSGDALIGTGGGPIVVAIAENQIALVWWFSVGGDGGYVPAISVVEGDEPVWEHDESAPIEGSASNWGGGTITGNGQYQIGAPTGNIYTHVIVCDQA